MKESRFRLRGWVLDIGATPRVVAHFTARDPEMFARVARSYRRGYAGDQFVVVGEVDCDSTTEGS